MRRSDAAAAWGVDAASLPGLSASELLAALGARVRRPLVIASSILISTLLMIVGRYTPEH